MYVLKRSYAVSEGGVDSDVNALVVEQAMAIWDECVGLDAQKGKGVKVDREAVVRSVGRVVRGFLRDGEESRVFGVGKKLQEALVKRVREDVEKLSKTAEGNDSEVWRAIRVLGEEGVQVDSWKLRNVVLEDVLGFFSKQEQQGASGVLREGLDEVGGDVWADGGVGNVCSSHHLWGSILISFLPADGRRSPSLHRLRIRSIQHAAARSHRRILRSPIPRFRPRGPRSGQHRLEHIPTLHHLFEWHHRAALTPPPTHSGSSGSLRRRDSELRVSPPLWTALSGQGSWVG